MKVTGSATLAVPLPVVWDALQDPAVLARTIPGCESLAEVGAGSYQMMISAGVASIKGTYAGEVTLSDHEPPHAFTLRATGQGAPGTIDATVRVLLAEAAEGTRVDYAADATVGGMVGGVGQRMLAGVGKKMAGQFFAAVERDLAAPPTPVAGAPAGQVPHSRPPEHTRAPDRTHAPEYARPPAVRTSSDTLAAFGAGGVVALAGVALGWAIARRSQR